MAATQQKEETFIVTINYGDSPFLRRFVEATSETAALALAQESCDEGESPAKAEALQPILETIIEKREAGANFSVGFKHEDEGDDYVPVGPVFITDLDAMRAEAERQGAIREDGSIVLAVPFGTTPAYETPLPWMSKADAARLADYVGIPLSES